MSMFSSIGSSDRSSMCELNSGSPVCSKCSSPASSRPAIQPSLASGSGRCGGRPGAVRLGQRAHVPRAGHRPEDRGLVARHGHALPATNAEPLSRTG